MTEIIMPQVGQDIPTARIVEWLKSKGDPVTKGEVILTVESDKATFEVEAETDGTLTHIFFEEGSEVEVFKPIALINGADDAEKAPYNDREEAMPAAVENAEIVASSRFENHPVLTALGRPRSSPAARRLARERNVDLAALRGTGTSGRILFADVLEAAEAREQDAPKSMPKPASLVARPPQPVSQLTPDEEDTVIPFTSMRRIIAERMTQSVQTIPHFYLSSDIDMAAAMAWRKVFNAAGGAKVSITDIIVKACAVALRAMPAFNSFVEADRVIQKGHIHVGVATAVAEGLMVPVIPDANMKTLQEISRTSRENAEAAARGQINLDYKATFTVTSLGMMGVPSFLPIINPPQCAILSVGAVTERVVPVEGGIGVRPLMTITLAADHRAVDGASAARFLQQVKGAIENLPEQINEWVGAAA